MLSNFGFGAAAAIATEVADGENSASFVEARRQRKGSKVKDSDAAGTASGAGSSRSGRQASLRRIA